MASQECPFRIKCAECNGRLSHDCPLNGSVKRKCRKCGSRWIIRMEKGECTKMVILDPPPQGGDIGEATARCGPPTSMSKLGDALIDGRGSWKLMLPPGTINVLPFKQKTRTLDHGLKIPGED